MTMAVSCPLIWEMASTRLAAQIEIAPLPLPGRFCAPFSIDPSPLMTPGQAIPMKGASLNPSFFAFAISSLRILTIRFSSSSALRHFDLPKRSPWTERSLGQRRFIAIIAKGDVDMGIFTKDIKSMEDLLTHGLQDIYYAEQQILKALPKMIDKATNRDLVAGLKNHLEETNKQVERLQKVFEKLGKQPSGTQCPAIDGIIKEADETAGEIADKAVLDAAIVANAQAVEHYEMCRYGTLIAWAEELGHDEIVRFLTTNLNEEKAANTKLNTVALRKGVNAKASTAA
jgi:ferritin-like metal-binding protein YciE